MTPTASRLELFERCPAVGALPAVWTESTDDQAAGTGRHAFLQAAAEQGRDAALAAIPPDATWRATCEGIDLDEIPHGRHEIAYAYDPATDTARELGPYLARAYDAAPGEITGTVDLVCPPTAERPRWLVIDFKGDEEVTPAATNLQLGLYALAVARVVGVDEIDVAIVYVGHGGTLRWDRATLDAFALAHVASRVASLSAAVTRARTEGPESYAVGLHCRRCPALAVCPAQTQLLRAFDAGASLEVVDSLPTLTDEAAGAAWERVKVLGEVLDAVKASLRARAEVRGLPLPDGSRLVPVQQERRSVDLARALPVLRARFGEQADDAVERSLSAESVTRLARQLAPGKGQRKAVDELWSALAAAKAVRTSRHVQLRVKKSNAAPEAATEEGV